MKRLLSLAIAFIMLCTTLITANAQDSYTETKLDIRGVDISSYFSLINSGVEFCDYNGNKLDDSEFFALLRKNSVNYIRVRVWNNPYDADGNGYGGGNCDLENAVKIGRLAAENNIKLLVDFHLSDFWTDPSQQRAPKDWQKLSLSQKQSAVYDYVKSSLSTLIENGADIGMVQIGNEINSGMCGETNQKNIAQLLKSGFSAVNDTDSKILRAVHYTDPQKNAFDWFAGNLKSCGVDYDVFASSYYPYWHGSAENLTKQLKGIADKYGKYVMVAETAYPFTKEDSDFHANNINGYESTLEYPVSVEGQKNAVADVFNAVAKVGDKGLGVFYWEPAWITVGTESYEKNFALWEKYGSGWESTFAAEYCEDKAYYHGGSSWDNQALFDKFGKPLDSLRVFADFDGITHDIGDVNLNGRITIDDTTLLQKFLADNTQLNDEQLIVSDTNYDGKVNIDDATLIQKYLADICSVF